MSIIDAAKQQIATAVYTAKDKVPCNRIIARLQQCPPRALQYQNAGMQATDIITAAAPINIKKQDLLDLESGVSTSPDCAAPVATFGVCLTKPCVSRLEKGQ